MRSSSRISILVVGPAPGAGPKTHPFDGSVGRRMTGILGTDRWRATNILDEWPGPNVSMTGDDLDPEKLRSSAGPVKKLIAEYDLVVVAGRAAARALGLRLPFFETMTVGFTCICVVPHPSGRNRWWNDPTRVAEARRYLCRLIQQSRR